MPDCFLTPEFNELNSNKVDHMVILNHSGCRMVGGIREKILLSPFSAPYGGITCGDSEININGFGEYLEEYLEKESYNCRITFPAPVIKDKIIEINEILRFYLLKKGAKIEWIDYNYHIDLTGFKIADSVLRHYKQGLNAGYKLKVTDYDEEHLKIIYGIVQSNHETLGYPMSMSLTDYIRTANRMKMKLFSVVDKQDQPIAGTIIYNTRRGVMQMITWGDLIEYRKSVGPMSFMACSIIHWIKENVKDIKVLDLGTASKLGERIEGLIRFKKNLGAVETEKYTISWTKS